MLCTDLAPERDKSAEISSSPPNPTDIAKPTRQTTAYCGGQEPTTPRSQETQRNGVNSSKLGHPCLLPAHPSHQENPRNTKNRPPDPGTHAAVGSQTAHRRDKYPIQIPLSQQPQQWQRITPAAPRRKKQCRLRRSPEESGSRRCYVLPPPPRETVGLGCGMAEWGVGEARREGDREREGGARLPPHAGRQAQQTDRVERGRVERE